MGELGRYEILCLSLPFDVSNSVDTSDLFIKVDEDHLCKSYVDCGGSFITEIQSHLYS